MIYLDNAATTWPKPEAVYVAIDSAMREHGANPRRGAYRMSVEAERLANGTRRAIAKFFNAPAPERVIFTLNGTDALNIALHGLIKPNDRVVTGPFEHNAVTRPLQALRGAGAQVAAARPAGALGIDLDHFRSLCRERLDYVVISHVSNVTGCVAPVKEIAAITHERGGVLILDAAQSAGTLEIDMQDLGVDVLAAPGHKGLYGPMGTGVLVLAAALPVRPFRQGGTGFKPESLEQPAEYPWRLEAGTLNLPGIAGLAAGLRFVQSTGVSEIAKHGSQLAQILSARLRKIDGIAVFGDPAPRTGVVSFRLAETGAALTGTILDASFGIAVSTGLHGAPAAHRAIGTFPEGTVRASFGQFNTAADVEALLAALRHINAAPNPAA